MARPYLDSAHCTHFLSCKQIHLTLKVLIPDFRAYFPSFEVKSCFQGSNRFTSGDDIDEKFHLHLYLTIEVYLVFNFLLDALLMCFIFALRKVQSEFSMTNELSVITGT